MKELLEFIYAENHAKNLEFNSDGLQEIIDSKVNGSATDRSRYKKGIGNLIQRLKDVETNGYSPMEVTVEYLDNELSEKSTHEPPAKSKKSMEETKSSKKKKKKKKKNQASNDDAEEASVTASVSSVAKREAEVDLVSMLIAMGFTEEQIHAAADACGGTDRATADDLVEWILGGGTSDNNSRNNETGGSIGDNTSLIKEPSRESNMPQTVALEQKQKRAAMQAKKEAEEAAKREAEAKAAAERLAAKREEQRRIRREWNNKEQLRQQEEAKAKLAEEVERKRRIEIEKAKAVAQRVAKERAVANAALMYQEPVMIHGGNVLPVVSNANVGATPLFPGASSSFAGSNTHQMPPENQYYPDMNSSNLSFNQPMMQQAAPRSYSQVTPAFMSTPNPPTDNSILSTPDQSDSRSKSKKTSPTNLEVNGYEFPVLGATKPSSPLRRHRSKNKDSPKSGENRKVGRSSSRKKKSESPSKRNPSLEHSPPPPPPPTIMQSADNQGASADSESYQSNPLGEIRATAKVFVPSNFTPSASPPPPPGLVNSQPSAPPGLVNASTSSNPLLPSNLGTASILSNSASTIIPRNPGAGSSMLSNNSSSILQSNPTPFDRSSSVSSHAISQHYNDLAEQAQSIGNVGIASSTSSSISNIVGLSASATEENVSLPFGSTPTKMKNDGGLLGSPAPLSGVPGAITGSSLGILEPNIASSSLSGGSIWGGGGGATTAATAATNPSLPATSHLGGFSFNFSDNAGATGSVDNDQKKDSNSTSMWGSSGVSSISGGGGGSIW